MRNSRKDFPIFNSLLQSLEGIMSPLQCYMENVLSGEIQQSHGHFPLRKHAHAIYRKFFGCKMTIFTGKKNDIFLIFAQNMDCGYTLEPPE